MNRKDQYGKPAYGWARRGFTQAIAGSSAALLLPRALLAQTNPDVVVVGAGSAGLAAAHTLLAQGKSVVVLEAAGRLGGRAWTERETFGLPFDQGCSWITSANANPYRALADAQGFELHNHDDAQEHLFVGQRKANAHEWAQYGDAWDAITAALRNGAKSGSDVAAASLMPQMPFVGTSQTWMGPMDMGVDFKNMSTRDFSNVASSRPSFMVKQGFGALVSSFGAGLPVRLNTPVSRVNWGGSGVTVETSAGVLHAKACILTVSTGVLGADSIVFNPPLPDWKLAAISDLPMGLLAKIALQFRGTRFGLADNAWLTYLVAEAMPAEACFFLCWPFGYDLMIGFVGGEFGFELSKAGSSAAIDFGLGELRKLFGGQVDKQFVRGHFTDWATNPFTLGGYAAVKPGRTKAREQLETSLAERLFFAGEAVAGPYVATCGGAFLSGRKTALEVARLIG